MIAMPAVVAVAMAITVMAIPVTMRTAMMVVARRPRAFSIRCQRIGYLLGVGEGLCGGQCISTPTIP